MSGLFFFYLLAGFGILFFGSGEVVKRLPAWMPDPQKGINAMLIGGAVVAFWPMFVGWAVWNLYQSKK